MNDISPSPADRLSIDVEETDSGATCFVLNGELDPHTAPMLQELIDERAGDATSIVLDVAGVGFVDSAGLRVIADTHRRLSETDGALVLRSPSSGLQKLLGVTGLAEHVVIEP